MADKKNKTSSNETSTAHDPSRRKFLKTSGYVTGYVVGGGLIGSLIGVNFSGEDKDAVQEAPKFSNALMFFTNIEDFQILSAATERIYPKDDNGPGAVKLDVPYFIDHQLAGTYGNNTNEYMQAPFRKGTDFQGYQTRLKRHEIFMQGIHEIDRQSKKEFDESFVDIEGDQQDKILSKFDKGDVKMKGVTSDEFFDLLLSATLAGAYSDPLYGGNSEMAGWKMKDFPGSQMSYIDDIEKKDFIKMKPKSLNNHL